MVNPASPASAPQPARTPDGLLLVDKPKGWTSHDVVAKGRRLAGTRKVGHAGTLDPMATGVLVLGIGKATRLLTFLVGCDKAYAATVRLGAATVTDDAEGEITARTPVLLTEAAPLDGTVLLDGSVRQPEGLEGAGPVLLDEAALRSAVDALTGAIAQVPSAVSAIKIDGQRAYARVRSGEAVELQARPVTVSRFEVVARRQVNVEGLPMVDLDIEVDVSSGTYVRALARDLGAALGVGGHLTALRRTRVGRFDLADATPLDVLVTGHEQGRELPVLALNEAAAAFAQRHLTAQEATALSFGQRIASQPPGRAEPVAALSPAGELIAMLDETRPLAKPHVVFAPASS